MLPKSVNTGRGLRSATALALSLAALSQAAPSTSEVLSFESITAWTRSAGDAAPGRDHVEGSAALALTHFYYTELLTPQLSWPGGGTGEIDLDVNLPAGTSWGNIALVVTSPSAQVWEQTIGQANFSASTPVGWNTLKFKIPASLLAVFQSPRTDLQFKLRLNLPWTESGYILDNLRFASTAAVSKVEIRVPAVQDLVYLQINGLRKRVAWSGQYGASSAPWIDATSWFVGGQNSARLQATAWNRGGTFQFEMRVDGGAVATYSCAGGGCANDSGAGIYFDKPLIVPSLNLPAAQSVRVVSSEGGRIYVDDEYTGLTSPATLKLPRGTYKIGMGVSSDIAPNYAGRFYEQTVSVGASPVYLDMGTQNAPLPKQNTTRIAVLPVKYASMDDRPGPGILTQAMVDNLAKQIETTRSKVFVPFSYGLSDWNVTVLPLETDLAIHAPAALDVIDHSGDILNTPKYRNLTSQYDFIVVVHSTYDADGNFIPSMGNRAGSGGQVIGYPINWSWPWGWNHPLDGLLHEILHQYDSRQRDLQHLYTGVQELHGANAHGYTPYEGTWDTWYSTEEWLTWYKDFIRGQAGETGAMMANIFPSSKPAFAPYYVGTFASIRYGMNASWQH